MIEVSLELRLALAVLAVFRLAELITIDIGPFGIFEKFRLSMGRKASQRNGNVFKEIAELVNCPFCTGVWVSAAISVLVLIPTTVGNAILVVFGLAGAQSFLQQMSARSVSE